MKTCSKCLVGKPTEDFSRDRTRPDGFFPYCKSCHRDRQREITTPEQRKERRQRHQAKLAVNAELRERYLAKGMEWTVRQRYGLEPADYLSMHDEQGGACAICGDVPMRSGRFRKSLCVDHDHESGTVRALLCDPCNRGLGAFKDDPRRVAAALAYLDQHARIEVTA